MAKQWYRHRPKHTITKKWQSPNVGNEVVIQKNSIPQQKTAFHSFLPFCGDIIYGYWATTPNIVWKWE